MIRIGVVISLILITALRVVAQRGVILDSASTNVLDPNGDGYVSQTTAGFSNDGYYPDEFEFPMFGIPIFEEGEVLNDIQAGALCGTTDLAVDTAGFAAYGVMDDNNNLIFRFRLAGDRPSVEAYTILIDTDQALGQFDPNSTPENPGFEIDITLIKSETQGIFVFNLDGIEDCPSADLTYPFSSHFQKAVAGTLSCDDEDFFLDFYVPFADLNATYGITLQDELRFVALTNVSATCAMAGKISDIGGVNDSNYDGCNSCAFLDLGTAQCPTALDNLCQTCEGFLSEPTERPEINTPIKVGESVITGTSVPDATIFLDVFDVNSTLVGQDTTLADGSGDWISQLDNPLQFEDSVTARAQVFGQCQSGISASDLSFALVIVNQPPSLSGTSENLIYTENDGAIPVDDAIAVSDPDDTELDTAWISISANYTPSEDLLSFTDQSGITGTYDAGSGVLKLIGKASLAAYQTALRSITYSNSSEDPSTAVRTVDFVVHDGLDSSNIFSREIEVVNVNDPPVVDGSDTPLPYTAGDGSVIIDGALTVSDLDHTSLVGGKVFFTANFISSEDSIGFSDQSGITGTYDPSTGTISLSGTATLADYQAAIRSITYTNDNLNPNTLTRRVGFKLTDGVDSSATFVRAIDMSDENFAPVIVDENDNPIDSLFVSTNEDVNLEICLDVNDPDGDFVDVTETTVKNGLGTTELNPDGGLCFNFIPGPDLNGQEFIKTKVCDQGDPSLCDSVIVVVDIIPVDDLPVIVDELGNELDTLLVTTPEDTPIEVCIDVEDVESDPVEVTEGSSDTGNGTIDVTPTGDLCFNFIPDPDFNGEDIGEVIVCQTNNPDNCDTLTVIVDVTPVNDPPEIQVNGNPVDTVFFTAKEDSLAEFCVEAIDPDGDFINVSDAYSTSGNGIFEAAPFDDLCFFFLPNENFNGEEIGELVVCDDKNPQLCDTVIAVIDVLPVNDPPVVVDTVSSSGIDTVQVTTDEDVPIEICLNVEDVENDETEISNANSITGNGTIDFNTDSATCFNFTPDPDFSGEDIIEVITCEIDDPSACDTVIVIVDILPVNDPPVITDGGTPVDTLFFSTLEDTPADFCADAFDVENDSLEVSSAISISGNGTFDHQPVGDLCFNFVPNPDFNGQEIGEIVVCDVNAPNSCDTSVVVVDVIPQNDPPEISFEGNILDTLDLTTEEDTPLEFCIKVDDPDNDDITVNSITSTTNNGVYETSSSGAFCFIFTPNENFNGSEMGMIEVCDTGSPSLCDQILLSIEVTPVNDAPIALNDTITTLRNQEGRGNVLANDSDIENDVLIVNTTPEESPVSGTVTISQDGSFVYTPNPAFSGNDTFTYTVCDQGDPSQCDAASVLVIIEDIPLTIYQAVSPNGDGLNDEWIIEGIELFPNNLVRIYDRYNNLIFEISGYNNQDKVWRGESNEGFSNKDVSNGTYFYVINLGDGSGLIDGFVVLKKD